MLPSSRRSIGSDATLIPHYDAEALSRDAYRRGFDNGKLRLAGDYYRPRRARLPGMVPAYGPDEEGAREGGKSEPSLTVGQAR
jgi:hypothetical protein